MNGFSSRLLARWVFPIASLGLVTATLPMPTAIAANDSQDDFRRCTARLTDLNVSLEDAVSACSRNLAPENLWKCVVQVNRNGYEPAAALNACRQVRQPREMAACVSGIRGQWRDGAADTILESCRRSLLPVRYADCVVGMGRGAKELALPLALSSCNDELMFPREVDPTFIAYPDGQPPLIAPTPLPAPAPVFPAPTPAPAPAPQPAPAPVRGLF